MSIFLGFSLFRFHRNHKKILAIYETFLSSPKRRLHPIEIGRESGLHSLDTIKVLQSTPEIFLKVPGDGSSTTSMYALRPSILVQNSRSVVWYINRLALRDRLLYYGTLFLVAVTILVVALRSIYYIRLLF